MSDAEEFAHLKQCNEMLYRDWKKAEREAEQLRTEWDASREAGLTLSTRNAALREENEQLRVALIWCRNEINMRCDRAIPSVRQAIDAADAAIRAKND
jgi:hypothetical protein